MKILFWLKQGRIEKYELLEKTTWRFRNDKEIMDFHERWVKEEGYPNLSVADIQTSGFDYPNEKQRFVVQRSLLVHIRKDGGIIKEWSPWKVRSRYTTKKQAEKIASKKRGEKEPLNPFISGIKYRVKEYKRIK